MVSGYQDRAGDAHVTAIASAGRGGRHCDAGCWTRAEGASMECRAIPGTSSSAPLAGAARPCVSAATRRGCAIPDFPRSSDHGPRAGAGSRLAFVGYGVRLRDDTGADDAGGSSSQRFGLDRLPAWIHRHRRRRDRPRRWRKIGLSSRSVGRRRRTCAVSPRVAGAADDRRGGDACEPRRPPQRDRTRPDPPRHQRLRVVARARRDLVDRGVPCRRTACEPGAGRIWAC